MSSDENETTQSKVNIKIEQDTSISSLAAKRRKINHIDALPKSYQKNKTLPEPSTSNADDRKGKSLKRKAPGKFAKMLPMLKIFSDSLFYQTISTDTVICSDCKVTFKKADYARHLEESSCNSQVCNYPDCGKRFATIKRLKQHFALHNEEGFCSVCNTAYQPGDLNLHLSCRPIACTFAGCNRRFKLLSAFKSHFRSHTNAELLCPYENCKKTFKEDRFLKAHIISKHKNDTLPSTKRQSNVDFNQSQDLDDPMNLMELVCSQYED